MHELLKPAGDSWPVWMLCGALISLYGSFIKWRTKREHEKTHHKKAPRT